MSLTGVRDMVTITTPPSNRHAIQTYVTEYDDHIVKDAILREKERGGQTFFVYNRIETIGAMADHLRSILPEDVTIGIAYGRMEGRQLERVMLDFYQGKYDALLCTTLIENGLDQPNANTMLVYDADRLGLSQIYQMRGRVGRQKRSHGRGSSTGGGRCFPKSQKNDWIRSVNSQSWEAASKSPCGIWRSAVPEIF